MIVGVAQLRRRPELDGPFEPIEPVQMMVDAVGRASADAGDPALYQEADYLGTIPPLAWPYQDTPRAAGRAAGDEPGDAPRAQAGRQLAHRAGEPRRHRHRARGGACGDSRRGRGAPRSPAGRAGGDPSRSLVPAARHPDRRGAARAAADDVAPRVCATASRCPSTSSRSSRTRSARAPGAPSRSTRRSSAA